MNKNEKEILKERDGEVNRKEALTNLTMYTLMENKTKLFRPKLDPNKQRKKLKKNKPSTFMRKVEMLTVPLYLVLRCRVH